jgi:hypothetical protein
MSLNGLQNQRDRDERHRDQQQVVALACKNTDHDKPSYIHIAAPRALGSDLPIE